MMARDRVVWAQIWSESRSRSYDSSEDPAQAALDKPAPE